MLTVKELIEKLINANDKKSLATKKTINTTIKNSSNIVENSVKNLLLEVGMTEQEKVIPTKNEIEQEYLKQTEKTYYKLSTKEGKALSDIDKANQTLKIEEIKEELEKIPKIGHFIYQPNGTQNSPDFYLHLDTFLNLEIKSGNMMMFNSGLPKPDTFYMCEYLDGTAYRNFGKDLFASSVCDLMNRIREEFEEHNANTIERLQKNGKFSNEELIKIKENHLDLYPRAMSKPMSANSKIWNKEV